MATHMCYVWSVSVCLWSSNHAQSALSTPRMRAIPIPRFWIMSIRVTLFPLFSWFIMKTGKLKWILTSEAQSCLFFFLFFFFFSANPSSYCGTQSLAALLPLQTCCFQASQEMIWLGGSNSHWHTLRLRDVAPLIRGLHLYSQLWPHLKIYATAQLYLNVLVSFFSGILKKFTGDLFGQIL